MLDAGAALAQEPVPSILLSSPEPISSTDVGLALPTTELELPKKINKNSTLIVSMGFIVKSQESELCV